MYTLLPTETTGGYGYIMLSANMHQYFTWKCFTWWQAAHPTIQVCH